MAGSARKVSWKTCVVAMAVVCILVLAHSVRRLQLRAASLRTIEGTGGIVAPVEAASSVLGQWMTPFSLSVTFGVDFIKITEAPIDAELGDALAIFREAEILCLERCVITEPAAASLARLTEVHTVSLMDCRFERNSAHFLKQMDSIEHLDLSSTNLTDEAATNLETLRKLKILSLTETEITSAALEPLSGSALEILCLSGTQVDDRVIDPVSTMEKLEILHVTGTTITDDGVRRLSRLPRLRLLSPPKVEDDGGVAP